MYILYWIMKVEMINFDFFLILYTWFDILSKILSIIIITNNSIKNKCIYICICNRIDFARLLQICEYVSIIIVYWLSIFKIIDRFYIQGVQQITLKINLRKRTPSNRYLKTFKIIPNGKNFLWNFYPNKNKICAPDNIEWGVFLSNL